MQAKTEVPRKWLGSGRYPNSRIIAPEPKRVLSKRPVQSYCGKEEPFEYDLTTPFIEMKPELRAPVYGCQIAWQTAPLWDYPNLCAELHLSQRATWGSARWLYASERRMAVRHFRPWSYPTGTPEFLKSHTLWGLYSRGQGALTEPFNALSSLVIWIFPSQLSIVALCPGFTACWELKVLKLRSERRVNLLEFAFISAQKGSLNWNIRSLSLTETEKALSEKIPKGNAVAYDFCLAHGWIPITGAAFALASYAFHR